MEKNMVPALDNVPVGFRFLPTDEELVNYYLKHKMLDDNYPINIIPEIVLCKVEPWHVPGLSMIKSDDPEWFFFSPVDYKYPNSKRVKRTTNCGYWKSTGTDLKIKARGTNDVIGTKKTLVYYKGRVPNGVNSNWVIHEYHPVTTSHQSQRSFVLCRLKNKAGKGGIDASICDEGEPITSGHMASSHHENMATEEGTRPVGAFPETNTGPTFQSMLQEEIDFSPVQQSSGGIEQEASFTSYPVDNAYFKNEENIVQTPFETIEDGSEFSTSILAQIQQSPIGIEQEASFTCFPAHNADFRNEDCDMQTPFETIVEGNVFPTSILAQIQQSPIGIEQEASFACFPAHSADFRNEDCDMQTPFETIAEENVFPTSILAQIQQSPIGIEQEASFTCFPAHSADFRNEDCDMQTPFETIAEGNAFPTSIVTPIQDSLIGSEQETLFTSFPAYNAYYSNEGCDTQTPTIETIERENESLTSILTPFEITEEDKEFLKSFFVDGNFVNEESGHVFFNSTTQPESLKRVHSESNDTDAEVASTLYGNIVDTSAMSNVHPSSGEFHVSKMLKSTHGTVDGGIHLASCDPEANKEESIIQNDFWGVETSSCDSTTDKLLEVNCFEISSLPSTLGRRKNKHHPKPSNFISQKTTARRSQIQRKASSNAVSHLEVRKSNNCIREMEKPT